MASSSGSSFYVTKMKGLPQRYGLSKNIQKLFISLDDFRCGTISDSELGRIVRFSPKMRKSITETIATLAGIMEKKPVEVSNCVALLQNCTELLKVADEPAQMEGFNLTKLPAEVRKLVYDKYFEKLFGPGKRTMMSGRKKAGCGCALGTPSHELATTNIPLARTSRTLKNEVLTAFFEKYVFAFNCACDMQNKLASNSLMRNNIRSVHVHWCGGVADKAFATLKTCSSLKNLHLTISKSTSQHVTPREAKMQRAFHASNRIARLSDALGIDELLQLRGLDKVEVKHVSARQAAKRTDEEKTNLYILLKGEIVGQGHV